MLKKIRSVASSLTLHKRWFRQFKNDVKAKYELKNVFIPQTFIVVRLDGNHYKHLTKFYEFHKPNDQPHINLMNQCALDMFKLFKPDMKICYAFSDECNFAFEQTVDLYNRELNKLVSVIVSKFTSLYLFNWNRYINKQLDEQYLPSFDAAVTQLPNHNLLRHYFHLRQLECHHNNLYNSVFWAILKNKKTSAAETYKHLLHKSTSDLNEILYRDYSINYNNQPAIYRKGTFYYKVREPHNEYIVEKHIDINKIDLETESRP